jgi:hypothetical protein
VDVTTPPSSAAVAAAESHETAAASAGVVPPAKPAKPARMPRRTNICLHLNENELAQEVAALGEREQQQQQNS